MVLGAQFRSNSEVKEYSSIGLTWLPPQSLAAPHARRARRGLLGPMAGMRRAAERRCSPASSPRGRPSRRREWHSIGRDSAGGKRALN